MSKRILIIAEAGVNHNGSAETAKRMIDAAYSAGADAVKFQTFVPEKLAGRFAQKAEYQKTFDSKEESQLEMLRKLELSKTAHLELMEYAKTCGIMFLSTAFDTDSIALLEELGIPLHKIPSGEITNLPYLIRIAQTQKPVILSTGMSEMDEVKAAVALLRENGAAEITVLHCNTEYPTPFCDVNLRAMRTLGEELRLPVGYSDHTLGIEMPIAAAALGASVIEKHFTLDKTMQGPDQKSSLEPNELAAMVTAIRNVEQGMGSGAKRVTPSERKNIVVARKSIVAAKPIGAGELLTEQNLTAKRPGNGVSPMRWYEALGSPAVRDFEEDELIEL